MSLLIKGAEMPTDCNRCPIDYHYRVCNGHKERCSIVEVPEPHGRLIEAPDVSEYEVFDEDTGTREISLFGLMECHRMVKDAETVIEAEE